MPSGIADYFLNGTRNYQNQRAYAEARTQAARQDANQQAIVNTLSNLTAAHEWASQHGAPGTDEYANAFNAVGSQAGLTPDQMNAFISLKVNPQLSAQQLASQKAAVAGKVPYMLAQDVEALWAPFDETPPKPGAPGATTPPPPQAQGHTPADFIAGPAPLRQSNWKAGEQAPWQGPIGGAPVKAATPVNRGPTAEQQRTWIGASATPKPQGEKVNGSDVQGTGQEEPPAGKTVIPSNAPDFGAGPAAAARIMSGAPSAIPAQGKPAGIQASKAPKNLSSIGITDPLTAQHFQLLEQMVGDKVPDGFLRSEFQRDPQGYRDLLDAIIKGVPDPNNPGQMRKLSMKEILSLVRGE